jgi:hypothetical protein
MVLWISALLFAAGMGVGLRARWAARRRALTRPRRVEEPNSHYSAPEVRRLTALERWRGIPLAGLHPVNQDEVRRLLDRVRLEGPDALAPREQRFLDNLVPRQVAPSCGTSSAASGPSRDSRFRC